MTKKKTGKVKENFANIFTGGGEMGARMRRTDWEKTPLGAVENWSQALRTSVSICLNSRFPMVIWWGRELVLLYNDGWRPILGKNKDKIALGTRGETVWAEIWDVLGPMFRQVLETGEATWNDDGLLLVNRYGFTEEAYFTWSYSPIRDDDGSIGGVFTAVTETTERVVGERRLQTLRDLGTRSLTESGAAEEACRAACEILARNPYDFPFASIYLLDEDEKNARLIESIRLDKKTKRAAPRRIKIGSRSADVWNLTRALETKNSVEIDDLAEKFGRMTAGAWADDETKKAVVVPLAKSGMQHHAPAGFLICGISPRLSFNEDYRSFLELVAGHIATAISNARALEEERRRAESLAALDRAKTEFFSNVSHEFRTPLTLMLAPVEEMLSKPEGGDLPENRKLLWVVHRNSVRLLKLVNNLLDFTRIEAGRHRASFEPTDLSVLTRELAGSFHSAVENAGLDLKIDCPPLSETLFIDREMWEKIVLNLLSNAFKFTFEGAIEVSLVEKSNAVELKVKDSGVGIPADQLEDVFKRFHRVRQTEGRTIEGTGIGLSLVRELARQHGGEISVESELGKGSTFTVKIPKGESHLPPELIASRKPGLFPAKERAADVFLNEVHDTTLTASPVIEKPAADSKPEILLADDNSDMRDYVCRLLEAAGYSVVAVADGQAALDYLQNCNGSLPELVLSDVMMPRLDGFALLEKLRKDERTRTIPVIMLSARAGEESKIEGFSASADDYLVKPFSAKELKARVSSIIELARMRRAVEAEREKSLQAVRAADERMALVAQATNDAIWDWDLQTDALWWNDGIRTLFGYTPDEVSDTAQWWKEHLHPEDRARVIEGITRVIESGSRQDWADEYRFLKADGTYAEVSDRGFVIRDADGKPARMLGGMTDITERKRAVEILERYRLISEKARDVVWLVRPDGQIVEVNEAAVQTYGYTREEFSRLNLNDLRESSTMPLFAGQMQQALEIGIQFETVHRRKDGTTFPVEVNANSAVIGGERLVLGIIRDITERKRRERNAGFLVEISQDFLQPLTEPEMMRMAAEKIGKFFGCGRCVLTEYEMTQGLARVICEWRAEKNGNVASLLGTHRMAEYFTDDFRKNILKGLPVAVSDVETDPRTSGRLGAYEKFKIRSFLRGNFLGSDGDLKFGIAVNCPAPREWRSDEIELLNELAARIWTRIVTARAETALRESEERLRLATGAAEMFSWETDFRSGLIKWSENAAEVIGCASEELPDDISKANFFILLEDAERLNREFAQIVAEGKTHYILEFRGNQPKNLMKFWQAQGVVIYDAIKKPQRVVGVTQNITARKQAELDAQFLAAVSERIQLADDVNALFDIVCEMTARHFGTTHCAFFDIDVERDAGRVSHEYRVEDARSIAFDFRPSDYPKDQIECLIKGKPLVVHDSKTDPLTAEIYPAAHEPWGYRAFITQPVMRNRKWVGSLAINDVSPRRWTKREIDLLKSVAERVWLATEKLRAEAERERLLQSEQDLRREAEQANRAKDEFLATVSHELRTPLNAILGWAQVLQNRNLGEADAKKALATIENSARAQNQLIEDILDVSRIITGNLRLAVRAVDLSRVISAVVESARPAAEAKNIDLKVLLDSTAGLISGDPDRLQQVVWNLLSNAIKFTPKDGRVEVRLEQADSNVEIIVSDTGKGIEPEFLPYVFDRFRQSDGSTTRRNAGLGLGLAIVRQLVELHGGTVSVNSAGIEQGATFTVSLPLLAPQQEPVNDIRRAHTTLETGDVSDCPPELTSLRILVVDDKADSRDLLKLVLDSCGAEVIAAESAAEAFEKVKNENFDVLISDIGMPGEDGFSLIRKIRKLPGDKGGSVPAIALTAYARAEDRVKALRSGFQMHIPKPVESSELIAVVGNLAGLLRNPDRNENS